ncbi:MAG UNVERIFIED_CONTAM: ATP-binding protein [Planctomycetaceae bacterium]|jgi:hypothetical protein
MYESYWKLKARPFPQATDPPLFFRSQSGAAALLRFRFAVENLSGPALLLGQSGCGKTSLVRWFASENASLRPFVHAVIPSLGVEEQLRMLLCELSEDQRGLGTSGPLDVIFRELRAQLAAIRPAAGDHCYSLTTLICCLTTVFSRSCCRCCIWRKLTLT